MKNIEIAFNTNYEDIVCSNVVVAVCLEHLITKERKIMIAQGEAVEHILLNNVLIGEYKAVLVPYFGKGPLELKL